MVIADHIHQGVREIPVNRHQGSDFSVSDAQDALFSLETELSRLDGFDHGAVFLGEAVIQGNLPNIVEESGQEGDLFQVPLFE